MSKQHNYRIRNWSEYNAGLKRRGSITFWLDEAVIEQWLNQERTGKRGASHTYSDLAIETVVTTKSIYKLAGRQTVGFVASSFELMQLDLAVPDHSTLSRRLAALDTDLPVVPKEGARHVVIDATGIKIYGEGEWKTRQHGISKRRTWRKLHLAVDERTGEVLAAEVTLNDKLENTDALNGSVSSVTTAAPSLKPLCSASKLSSARKLPLERSTIKSQNSSSKPKHLTK